MKKKIKWNKNFTWEISDEIVKKKYFIWNGGIVDFKKYKYKKKQNKNGKVK